MRGGWLVVCGVLGAVGCDDADDIEGVYRLDLRNGDDGCQFGWSSGGGFSSELTVARYEDRHGEHVVAVIGSTPGHDNLQMAGQGFTGTVLDGELVVWGGGMIETDSCLFFHAIEVRAEWRPNRFTNLRGQVAHKLNTWGDVPGCITGCVSYQDLEAEKY